MKNYEIKALFKTTDEVNKIANRFSEKNTSLNSDVTYFLNEILLGKPLNEHVHTDLDLDSSFEFLTNEIQIYAYTGNSQDDDKFLSLVREAFETSGSVAISLYIEYEDSSTKTYHYVGGKKTTAAKFKNNYHKVKIEDGTEKVRELLNFVKNNNVEKSLDIFFKCKPEVIATYDERFDDKKCPGLNFTGIFRKIEFNDLALGLLNIKKIHQKNLAYNIVYIQRIIESSSLEVFKIFEDMVIVDGFENYRLSSGSRNEVFTVLQWFFNYLDSDEDSAKEKLSYLIDHFPKLINEPTNIGSPLFLKSPSLGHPYYDILVNAGGMVVPPEGFYKDKSEEEELFLAVKHNDFNKFKQVYSPQYYEHCIFLGVDNGCLDILDVLDKERVIDWFLVLGEETHRILNKYELYLFTNIGEPLFMRATHHTSHAYTRHEQQPEMIDYIMKSLKENIKSKKADSVNFNEEWVKEVNKRISAYRRWQKKQSEKLLKPINNEFNDSGIH